MFRNLIIVLTFLLVFMGLASAGEVTISPGGDINKSYPLKPAENDTVYKNYFMQNLQGRSAKYVIAGRIQNDSGCDLRRFDTAKIREIVENSNSDIDAIEKLKRGKGDAISLSKLPFYCEFLYYEAANWAMTYPLTATSFELRQIKMLAATAQNNCNWSEQTNSEKIVFPEINNISQKIAGIKLGMMLASYSANPEDVFRANDEGEEFGLEPDPAKLKSNCIVIRDFAKTVKW